jgi:acyl-CoA thioesterase
VLDPYARLLGLTVTVPLPGSATASLVIAPEHANTHGTCHGAVLFALADAALQAASNSHGPQALATTVSIHYLKPAAVGETVVATAVEEHLGGRLALYRIGVRRDADLLAVADGQVAIRR